MTLNKIQNWLCYYGLEADADRYREVDLAVFNARWHPPLVGGQRRPCYCGYVSVGEIDTRGELWPRVVGQRFLVRENRRWGTRVVDVRDANWREIFVDQVVAAVLAEGFDGLFIDTLDAALSLAAWNDADTFAQLRRALVQILETIRQRHPDIAIIVNRGLPILDVLAPAVDAVVIEGLFSVFDPLRQSYHVVAEAVRGQLLDQLAGGLAMRPGLPVFSLDYAPDSGHHLAAAATAFAHRNGFIPFVGNTSLNCWFDPPGKAPRPVGGEKV